MQLEFLGLDSREKREQQRYAGNLLDYLSKEGQVHLCKKITQVWEQSHMKGLEGTVPSAHTEIVAGMVPVPIRQTGKPHNSQGEHLGKSCFNNVK